MPDVAELGNRTKCRSFELVDVVGEFIRTFNKFRLCHVDYLQLNFAKDSVIKADIQQNIVGSLSESILDANNLNPLGVRITHSVQSSVNLHYFLLFGGQLASNKVPDLEGDQIWRRLPFIPALVDIPLKELLGDIKQAVNQSVEIKHDISMQIADDMTCEFPRGLLIFGYEVDFVLLKIFEHD